MNLKALQKRAHDIAVDVFTGADGKTTAFGRFMSIPFALVGMIMPFVGMFSHALTFTLVDAGVYFASIGGTITVLVTGTDKTEPKG